MFYSEHKNHIYVRKCNKATTETRMKYKLRSFVLMSMTHWKSSFWWCAQSTTIPMGSRFPGTHPGSLILSKGPTLLRWELYCGQVSTLSPSVPGSCKFSGNCCEDEVSPCSEWVGDPSKISPDGLSTCIGRGDSVLGIMISSSSCSCSSCSFPWETSAEIVVMMGLSQQTLFDTNGGRHDDTIYQCCASLYRWDCWKGGWSRSIEFQAHCIVMLISLCMSDEVWENPFDFCLVWTFWWCGVSCRSL